MNEELLSCLTKTCPSCKVIFPLSGEFFSKNSRHKNGFNSYCRKCAYLVHRRWELRNPDKALARAKRYRDKNRTSRIEKAKIYYRNNIDACRTQKRNRRIRLRKQVFSQLGNSCKCCNESHEEFLTLNHVDGWGKLHRTVVRGSEEIYSEALKMGCPQDKFSILCWNCNAATRYNDPCPHQINVFS